MRLMLFVCAAVLFGFSVSAQESPTKASSEAVSQSPGANRTLVQALTLIEEAKQLSPWERFEAMDSARRLLNRLVDEFPESLIAVQLATGQKIGNFDIGEFRTEHEAAFSDACIVRDMEGCHPFLVQRIQELRQELRKHSALVQSLLAKFEAKDAESKATIDDLGGRLNKALLAKLQLAKLSSYRSEFFGRLREVLRGQHGIRIVGDRFVFQSEVLFGSGSAEMGVPGRIQLTKLVEVLLDISRKIPDDINWILRVDGHTDSVPISTARFPSNWELSAARAVAVAKYLIQQGLPPERLAPTGMGEFHPLEPGESELARRYNRRIELKLTER